MAFAQSTSGTITGTVTDPQGAMIAGTTITVTDTSTKQSRTTKTNGTGQYVLVNIVPGTYDMTAVKDGFSTDQILGIVVSVGAQTNANFRMALGSTNTTVDVQASNADLQTMNASTGTTVDPALVDSLPAIGRDVATFMEMQPGVAPGGQTAGTTADQTTFTLDGGANTSDMDGTAIGYTSGNTNSTTGGALGAGPAGVVPMPQDSIEEFKVSTTGQTADFAASSGSQSQVVTKRGHDQWHGTAYEYYLDNSFNANSWQNNFPKSIGYTPKPSYHYSRFGVAAGGAVLPRLLGGKTYLFANYEGFRYPLAATYERTVPSYAFLQQQQLTFAGTTYSQAALLAADPRGIGMPTTMNTYYNSELPVAPVTNSGSVGNNGATYAGTFDQSCGALSTSYCDGVNTIGYRANVNTPQRSNFLATRLDHDFGAKWHLMASYRYYNLQNLTNNQVDIGGQLPGDKIGTPVAVTPRPQQPWFLVLGMTTNISSSLTNDFHYSYLRNFWQWKGSGAPPQVSGAVGAIEPLGENTTTVLSPYNVNTQNIRTRIWNGKDNSFTDNLSKLKGDHFIQVGFSYQHNWNYHQRTDNGASINYTPTYQIGDAGGGGTATYSAAGLGSVGANASSNYARLLDTYYGIVTDTQVANTYSNVNGTLTLNPPNTPFGAKVSIPFYNIYATDTWHATKSLTLSYGLSYSIEMPPSEANGNQVQWTDTAGDAIHLDQWLTNRKNAAAAGQIYNPTIAFALLKNTLGNHKYIYNPYYGGAAPRISFAWNPKFQNKLLAKAFGDSATVIRGGYGRIYGRLNGSPEVLNPLLSPGLVLGTRCQYVQPSTTAAGTCLQSGYTDATTYRYGVDGISPLTASAPPPATLPQPYRPGVDGPGVSIASPLDPTLRPSDVDTFNLSIQRQINRKMLIEVGYIGRLIHHDYIYKNPNQVPYNLSYGGQTFESAYVAIETALGCTVSSSICQKSATPTSIAPQPFFEAALGGTGSAYCGATSCTQAVLNKQTSKFRQQDIFSLWQVLDNNVNGANGAGFVFGRSLSGTAITSPANAAYGSAGQVVTGQSIAVPDGYGNYNGIYLTYKVSGWHGLTAQENFTASKALGLGSFNQYSSSISAEDSYNLRQQYGRQPFDQKYIFNTFLVYQTPWYKDQQGIIGRLAGGWTISPVVQAGTGQPMTCSTFNSGQNFGGEDGSTFTDSESCILTSQYTGGHETHRGITGGIDNSSGTNISVGTSVHAGAPSAAVNMFQNPVLVYQTTRPPVLGIDARDNGAGPISGLGYLNMDLTVKKGVQIWHKTNLELSGTFLNVMNHNDFSNPSFSINSSAAFGVTKTQVSTPREIEMGARVSF
ncbi:carboxypeptidase-like regulatory domain-containing protein [Granulicella sp. 5B5]|uniref:carboxypeptidase-like regulatory domain-containing protein n=1 Tax=Granulicella sp. 5B5 TaxID=1617967 RepID=UPI001C71724B|nr:carboxypeptidase-like regulatory domain-containing protein [Granulicella sp. 5B5]